MIGYGTRKNKMGNEKASLDGYSFASKLECAIYQIIKLRIAAKEIKEVQVQAHVYLTDARILYIPDFRCTLSDGSDLFVEAKGFQTDVYRIKRRLWKHYGPAPLEVFMGSWQRPTLAETIIPVKS